MKEKDKNRSTFKKARSHDIHLYSSFSIECTTKDLDWPDLLIFTSKLHPMRGQFAPVDNLLIIMIVDGEMKGTWCLGDQISEINLKPGELLIVPPDYSFSVDLSSTCKLTSIYVGKNILEELFVNYSSSGGLFYRIDYKPHIEDVFLASMIFEVGSIIANIDNFSYMNVQYIVRVIVGRIISMHSFVEYDGININHNIGSFKIKEIFDYIDKNISTNMVLDNLSSIAELSNTQFVRLFKRATNITPHQYIIRRRVEHARKLLLETDKSIVEIAYDCGFADQVHLTKSFGRIMGISPAAYRKTGAKRSI